MIAKLLKLFNLDWLIWAGVAAGALSICAALVHRSGYNSGANKERAAALIQLNKERAAYQARVDEATERERRMREEKAAIEVAWLKVRDQHDAQLAAAYSRLDSMDLALRGERDAAARRVRDDTFAAAVARQCGGAQGAAAPAGEGAREVGLLVGDVLRFGAACAVAAERAGAGVRALLGAWPRGPLESATLGAGAAPAAPAPAP